MIENIARFTSPAQACKGSPSRNDDFVQYAELRLVDDLPCDRDGDRRQHHRDHQHCLQKGQPTDESVEQQCQPETEEEFDRHCRDCKDSGVAKRDVKLRVGKEPREIAGTDELPGQIGVGADLVDRRVEDVEAGENRQSEKNEHRWRKHEDPQMALCPTLQATAHARRRGQCAFIGLQHLPPVDNLSIRASSPRAGAAGNRLHHHGSGAKKPRFASSRPISGP
ncbi:hypothetical protein ABIE77_001198 [Sinorhizobium fredii]